MWRSQPGGGWLHEFEWTEWPCFSQQMALAFAVNSASWQETALGVGQCAGCSEANCKIEVREHERDQLVAGGNSLINQMADWQIESDVN